MRRFMFRAKPLPKVSTVGKADPGCLASLQMSVRLFSAILLMFHCWTELAVATGKETTWSVPPSLPWLTPTYKF